MDFSHLRDFIDSLPSVGIPTSDIIVWQNHTPLFRYGTGISGAPDPDGRYYMYSCSKVVTCAAALTLYERGKFLLDTPVSEILPEYAEKYLRVLAPDGSLSVPNGTPMTFRHLFTMTSGITYNLTSARLREIREASGGRCPTRNVARAIAAMPLAFAPGEKFLYGLSHDVLAAAVEVIADEDYDAYVRRVIFNPLGMSSSSYRLSAEAKEKMVPQYRFNDRTGVADPTEGNMYCLGDEYESGGAGLVSTPGDMILLADALSAGGVGASGARVLSSTAVRLMCTPQLTDAQRATFRWNAFGDSYSYGLGVRTHINPKGGALTPLHEFGWQGAAGSYLSSDTETGISIFYAQHMLNNKEAYVHPRLRNIVYASIEY